MEGERDLTTPTGRAKTVAIGCYVPVICNKTNYCICSLTCVHYEIELVVKIWSDTFNRRQGGVLNSRDLSSQMGS